MNICELFSYSPKLVCIFRRKLPWKSFPLYCPKWDISPGETRIYPHTPSWRPPHNMFRSSLFRVRTKSLKPSNSHPGWPQHTSGCSIYRIQSGWPGWIRGQFGVVPLSVSGLAGRPLICCKHPARPESRTLEIKYEFFYYHLRVLRNIHFTVNGIMRNARLKM